MRDAAQFARGAGRHVAEHVLHGSAVGQGALWGEEKKEVQSKMPRIDLRFQRDFSCFFHFFDTSWSHGATSTLRY